MPDPDAIVIAPDARSGGAFLSAEIAGTRVTATTIRDVLGFLAAAPIAGAYVCVCSAHGVVTARRDGELATAFAGAALVVPDGMPLVWLLRLRGLDVERCYGPDLIWGAFDVGRTAGWRHYLWGSAPPTLAALQERIDADLPGTNIVGAESPPFTTLDTADLAAFADRVRAAGATHVWVGVSTPKQDKLMARLAPLVPGVTLVGVGAAFDFHAGRIRQAPRRIQQLGLEWAYRLGQEPKRLWRRYAVVVPAFAALALADAGRTLAAGLGHRVRASARPVRRHREGTRPHA